MVDHDRIWLEPAPGADEEYGRQWAQHNVFANGVEYIRADLVQKIQASHLEATERAEEAVKAANALQIEVDRYRALGGIPPVDQTAGWQPIETVPKHESVILQSSWKHQPTAPMVFEGYLDWDGVTWRYQKGEPLNRDVSPPAFWRPLPAPMPAAATEADHG